MPESFASIVGGGLAKHWWTFEKQWKLVVKGYGKNSKRKIT
jgi:hypothetical protein